MAGRDLEESPFGLTYSAFLHKPLFMDHPSETVVNTSCLEFAARGPLLRLFARKSLRLVGCGHKHQYRSFGLDGVIHLWAPSTGAVNFPPDVKMWGRREVGFLDIRLGSQGIRQRLIGSEFFFVTRLKSEVWSTGRF